jgi:hypothetical protein
MTVILGQRNTTNVEQSTRRLDIGSEIALLDPDSTPFTALMNRINSQRAFSPKFQNFEDKLPPRKDLVNGAVLVGAGTAVVDNAAYFNVEDLVLNTRTNEMVRVTAVNTGTNTLTITRGVGSTAAAMNDNDELYILSSAAMEGDVSKQARSTTPTVVTNYTQIHRDPVDESNTALASDFVTELHDWDYVKKVKGIQHAIKIEAAAWWGKPSEVGSPAVRTSGGFFHFQGSTNQVDAGGTFTETELWSGARTTFRHGTKRKLMFAGGLVVQVMNQFAQSKVQTRQGDTTYGLAITDYVTPFGQLSVVYHPLFDDTDVYQGYGAIVDMVAVAKKYLHGQRAKKGPRDTHFVEQIQEADRDGEKGEYKSEVGVKIGQPERHGIFSGVTG